MRHGQHIEEDRENAEAGLFDEAHKMEFHMDRFSRYKWTTTMGEPVLIATGHSAGGKRKALHTFMSFTNVLELIDIYKGIAAWGAERVEANIAQQSNTLDLLRQFRETLGNGNGNGGNGNGGKKKG